MKGRPPKVSLKRIKNAWKMSDFFLADFNEDYIDFIKTKEDMHKFNRLKELLPQMKGIHPSKCLDQIKEFTKLDRELRGLQPVKFIEIPRNIRLN
jgi:hypothetical protein